MKRVFLTIIILLLPIVAHAAPPAELEPKFDEVTKEQALKTIREYSLVQYLYLLSFKSDPDFIETGFDSAGQFYAWIEISEALRMYARAACEHFGVKEGTDEAKPFFICMVVYSLGEEYAATGGKETDFSLDYKDYVSEFFGLTQDKHKTKKK